MTAALTTVGVQQFSITIASGSLTGTASITAVGAGAFITHMGHTASDTGAQYDDATASLTRSGTTITATRGVTGTSQTVIVKGTITDGNTTNLISSVQTGIITTTSGNATGTATVTSTTAANTAIQHLGISTNASTTAHNRLDTSLTLSGTTITATFGVNATGTNLTGFTIIAFQAAALAASVQQVNNTSSSLTTSSTTITSVTTTNTMLFYSGCNSAGGNPSTGGMQYGQLAGATTFTATWNGTASTARQYNCTVTPFVAGMLAQNVQRGTSTFTAQTSRSITITSSPLNASIANWLGNSSTATTANPSVEYYSLTYTSAVALAMAVTVSASGTGSYEVINFNPASAGGVASDVIWFGMTF